MSEPKPRVAEVSVDGLFGLYNHDVRLNLQERVTILHGPNGVGKTVLLHLIANLFSGRYVDIASVPFDRFRVRLDSGEELSLSRDAAKGGKSPKSSLRIELRQKSHIKSVYTLGEIASHQAVNRLANELPWMMRIENDSWLDQTSGSKEFSTIEVVNKHRERTSEFIRSMFPPEPDDIQQFRRSVEVHLVEAQRLLKITRPQDATHYVRSPAPLVTVSVEAIAQDLSQAIATTLTKYGSESATLDQSFPHRLLGEQSAQVGTDILKTKFQNVAKRIQDFRDIGLVEETMVPIDPESLDNLDITSQRALSLYVENLNKKLDVLQDLSDRINLLLSIVREKFKHKNIIVSKRSGLVAVDDKNRQLDLDDLSSGEQHELVMAYDLLFKVNKNALVMIDEPELSLHLNWQKAFLPDVLSIVKTTEFDVLLATHSPFIVGDSSDLMVELSSEEAPLR